jgi:hypothetical protein
VKHGQNSQTNVNVTYRLGALPQLADKCFVKSQARLMPLEGCLNVFFVAFFIDRYLAKVIRAQDVVIFDIHDYGYIIQLYGKLGV